MIFDNAKVTATLKEWKSTRKKELLARVFDESRSLVEAIVSSYDVEYRDDMIQNAYIKLLNACDKFEPSRGTTLHTYFTTVIHNICRTTLKMESKHLNIYDIDTVDKEDNAQEINHSEDISYLIEYCRLRFPNLDPNDVDYIVIAFVNMLSIDGKLTRDYCRKLEVEIGVDLKTIEFISKIVMIMLRYSHMEDVLFEVGEDGTIHKNGNTTNTYLPELIHIFGEDVANQMTVIFSGLTLRL